MPSLAILLPTPPCKALCLPATHADSTFYQGLWKIYKLRKCIRSLFNQRACLLETLMIDKLLALEGNQ
jgi:hypothetical protein